MSPNPHKIRRFVCDLKQAWQRIRHAKAARWTVGVHVIYYIHAATDARGFHVITAAACAAVLLLEFFSREH